ncbi:MAG: cupin domain-containing protein [Gammaproteobacteria bacterium]|nr:cupin domain-containing protein [Gammaproteobacteria bacterium]
MNKHEIISKLSLQPHPSEGGYFKRTYCSEIVTTCPAGTRNTLTSIYYMLSDDSPIGYLHKNKSDIIHYFHSGSAINYTIIHPDGQMENHTLGNDLSRDQIPQLTVKGGCWKASVLSEGQYGLISEAVSPGFEYEDMELAREKNIREHFPVLFESVKMYIRQT